MARWSAACRRSFRLWAGRGFGLVRVHSDRCELSTSFCSLSFFLSPSVRFIVRPRPSFGLAFRVPAFAVVGIVSMTGLDSRTGHNMARASCIHRFIINRRKCGVAAGSFGVVDTVSYQPGATLYSFLLECYYYARAHMPRGRSSMRCSHLLVFDRWPVFAYPC